MLTDTGPAHLAVADTRLDAMARPTSTPLVRPLGADDEIRFRDLLLDLDPPSRIARFACSTSDAGMAQHSRRAFSTAAFIAGAFAEDRLRGIVEVYDIDRRRGRCEAAFVVAPGWRRRGFGFLLLQAAVRWALITERSALRLMFSRSNWPMRQLARKAGARFDLVLDEIEADILIGDRHVANVGRAFSAEVDPVRRQENATNQRI